MRTFKPPDMPLNGPWGNLTAQERAEVISSTWEKMNKEEKKILNNMAHHMGIRSLGLKGMLDLIVSLYLNEKTRRELDK